MSLNLPVYPASACYAGYTHMEAMERLSQGASEPLLGELSLAQAQLCPQNISSLNESSCAQLRREFPNTAFRIHANTRCDGRFGLYDASSSWEDPGFLAWKKALKANCERLEARAYSWHAGRAQGCSREQMARNTLALEQELGIPVGVEGLYPSARESWLLSSFDDYQWLLSQECRFALDLSHWQILARASAEERLDLLSRLLSSERCIEIHLSDNDSRQDQHKVLKRSPFWYKTLCDLAENGKISAPLFSEGLQGIRAARKK